jgi:large subunit ribosomal protein L4
MRRLALKSALSSKVLSGELIVLDELAIAGPKTKEMVAILGNLKAQKALVITATEDFNVELSARNLPGVKAADTSELNVYDILAYDRLVMTKDAVARVEEVLG